MVHHRRSLWIPHRIELQHRNLEDTRRITIDNPLGLDSVNDAKRGVEHIAKRGRTRSKVGKDM